MTICEDTPSSSPITSKPPPTLLSLPREIRDEIYAHVIGGHEVSSSGQLIPAAESDDAIFLYTWHDLFTLSLVCHQTHAETKLLAYKLNAFQHAVGQQPANLPAFLTGPVDKDGKNAVRKVFFGAKFCAKRPLAEDVRGLIARLDDLAGLRTVAFRNINIYKEDWPLLEAYAKERRLAVSFEYYNEKGEMWCEAKVSYRKVSNGNPPATYGVVYSN
ncbi:predicted protein [Plenodomus lingam JN3]|uniref:Predicted protein n=1 Tax=Leptosphaeria maculans (strain JN3 / isolate v23.1.3 / race Av1-4-5-6-7-8) TaxID=985895 RepID=E4ZVF8_LEPMJ|nr:predicted protein [Plenodomus lingam JN3]CBX95584.1 predicted protein [Plenodomus lingam JN3]